MAEFNSVEKHYMDRAFQSNFALWTALLTINGVMISAFSLLRLIVPRVNSIVVVLLVGSCSLSVLLLVFNFLVTKKHYLETGKKLMNPEGADVNEAQRRQDIEKAIRKNRNNSPRESVVLFLLIIEVGLVITLLVLSGNG